MREEKLSDAIVYDKLKLLKKDFFGYIERHSEKVDTSLPVFYGYVISALETSFPHLPDDVYDEFIDSITFQVLDVSRSSGDAEYIRKVIASAVRFKRKKDAGTGITIVVGLKLLKSGDYSHALDYLKPCADLDAKLGMAVAYCYLALSRREFKEGDGTIDNHRPGEMELLARETLLTLIRIHPPLNSLPQLQVDDPSFLEHSFWQMVFLGLEWFPGEKWFVETGLENAVFSGNKEMRKRLLEIGSERFYTDIQFLREMFYYKLENRDAGGAAGVVNQLIQQYPDEPEPIYLGLKLSLLTIRKNSYRSFRKLAIAKSMPPDIIELLDFAFELFSHEPQEAANRIGDFESEFPHLRYYAIILRYLASDFSSEDEVRIRKAKKVLLDSVDQYCLDRLGKMK
ncbi:MAG: hypothetical protein EHM53_09005 [Methanoregulaceae archaeon]|nr:MAG: hypothetical protein EHM53_13970 [Methanoregulaceae archaeon]RPI38389.1 MAG: hypothetical protein EHM53_09005 [Methanoregulaceae archaeon]